MLKYDFTSRPYYTNALDLMKKINIPDDIKNENVKTIIQQTWVKILSDGINNIIGKTVETIIKKSAEKLVDVALLEDIDLSTQIKISVESSEYSFSFNSLSKDIIE